MRRVRVLPGMILGTAVFLPALVTAGAAVTVQALSFDRYLVDTSTAGQVVRATIRVSLTPGETIAGDFSSVFLDNSNGSYYQTFLGSGTPCGTNCLVFTPQLRFPQGTPAGSYYPSLLFDTSSGTAYFWYGTLAQAGLLAAILVSPGTAPAACTLPPLQPPPAGGGISDTTPPNLVGICLSTYSVDDTGPSGATVDVYLNVTDDLSGVTEASVYFYSPTGRQSQYAGSALASGCALSGIYRATVHLPPNSESGDWSYAVTVRDRAGNISQPAIPPGVPRSVTVLSDADTAPPVWVSGTVSGTVNVSAGAGEIPVSIHLKDDRSGVNPYQSGVGFTSPTGKQSIGLSFAGLQRSGTANDGTYTGTLTIPRYSEAGAWTIYNVWLTDNVSNTVYMASWGSLPAPSGSFTVVSNPSDTTPPLINSFSFIPAAVNTSIGDQAIQFSVGYTDALAGLGLWGPEAPNCHVEVSSPSGLQTHVLYPDSMVYSGTLNNGVASGALTLPRYSEIGTWKVDYIGCSDAANNSTVLDRAMLQARGFPTNLVVIQPSLVVDGTFGSGNHTVKDTASDTTLSDPSGELATGTTVAIDVLPEPPASEPPQGFSIGTGFVSVQLSPAPGGPLAPPGLTLVLPLVNQMVPGTGLLLYKVDLNSGKLVQAPKAGGGFVTGTVDPDGQSATFTGISTFSTVVGLLPPSRPGDLNSDGMVNCLDIQMIRDSWNKRAGQLGFDVRADYNRDGTVNIFDLAAVSKQLPRGTKCW